MAERSGERNTVGRNWGIKGTIRGVCPQFLDMLKRLPRAMLWGSLFVVFWVGPF